MIKSLLYLTWLKFSLRYRKTAFGPLWILVGPALFIVTLGKIYSVVSGIELSVFIPHLTLGLVFFNLISGFIVNSSTVFQRSRPQILQSGMSLSDIVLMDMGDIIIQFLHQLALIFIVLIYFQISITFYSLVSLLGLILLLANGYWLAIVFGIIGVRYRDLSEVTQAIMRIAFLATPIIWMPGEFGRGGALGPYLTFNPFYHFLEIVRAPLLNHPISLITWCVVLSITFLGYLIAHFFYHRYNKQVPLWV